jgi:hypothetical protein
VGFLEARRRRLGAAKEAVHGANFRHKIPGLKAKALPQGCPGEALGLLKVQGIKDRARGRNEYRSARGSKGRLSLQIHGAGPRQGQANGHVDELTRGSKPLRCQRTGEGFKAF